MGTRMQWAARIAAGAAAAGACLAQAQTPTPEQLFERLSPSVWTVETSDAQGRPLSIGSGVVVGPGSVVTNCHVLSKASRVVVGRENVTYGASLEHPDPERDLCLLKVANFHAPAVAMAGVDSLKVGARVYAIGSPRGLEQTISDGLLSGIRRTESGHFTALQITVPISKGSSGGGLFDAQGRLVGITTFQVRDGQNLNFALPAGWIAEIPQRARDALAAAAPAAPAKSSNTPMPVSGGDFVPGRTFEYRVTDRLTGMVRNVSYRVDRVDGDRVVFNQGALVQTLKGEVVHLAQASGGEVDAAMPPGGWVRHDAVVGASWSSKYRNKLTQPPIAMELRGHVAGEEVLQLAGRSLRTLRVTYEGFSLRGFDYPCGGPYRATAWFAPQLARVVRFDVQTQGCSMATRFVVDEHLELVGIY